MVGPAVDSAHARARDSKSQPRPCSRPGPATPGLAPPSRAVPRSLPCLARPCLARPSQARPRHVPCLARPRPAPPCPAWPWPCPVPRPSSPSARTGQGCRSARAAGRQSPRPTRASGLVQDGFQRPLVDAGQLRVNHGQRSDQLPLPEQRPDANVFRLADLSPLDQQFKAQLLSCLQMLLEIVLADQALQPRHRDRLAVNEQVELLLVNQGFRSACASCRSPRSCRPS